MTVTNETLHAATFVWRFSLKTGFVSGFSNFFALQPDGRFGFIGSEVEDHLILQGQFCRSCVEVAVQFNHILIEVSSVEQLIF